MLFRPSAASTLSHERHHPIRLSYKQSKSVILFSCLIIFSFWGGVAAQGRSEWSLPRLALQQETATGQQIDQAQNISALRYGAAAVVGEALEPCETTTARPTAKVLTPTDSWQSALKQAQPGTVFLLRGGLYQTSSVLTIGTGQLNRTVLVKPYNCEAVTLRGGVALLSYTTLAGLRLEGALPPKIGPNYVIRIDAKSQARQAIVIRNNTIVGGEIDAMRVNDNVVDVQITGNQIDGGKAGHNLFVTTETKPVVIAKSPDKILVSNNRFTKVYFRTLGIASEDMFQVRSVRSIQFLSNSCENGSRTEQCIDIKDTNVPAIIRANFINGTTLNQDGPGEDGSTGCMVIHEFDGHPETHLIESNYFKNCRTTIIRFASEGGTANSSGILRYNIFLNPDVSDNDALLVWRSENVIFEYNTMIRGALKLGRGNGLTLNPPIVPKNTILKNNLFYQTRIDDNTSPPNFVYQCRNNLLFQISQRGNRTLQCTASPTADPKLLSIAAEDYRPAANSPACTAAENSTTVGALPCQSVASALVLPASAAAEDASWYDADTNAGRMEAAVDTDSMYEFTTQETAVLVADDLPEVSADVVSDTLPIETGHEEQNALQSTLVYRGYLPLINR